MRKLFHENETRMQQLDSLIEIPEMMSRELVISFEG